LGAKPNDVYVPQEIAQYVTTYLHSAQELNNCINIDPKHEKQYNLHPVKPNTTFKFGQNFSVKVIKCSHGVPSVGYAFSESRQKLKKEYLGISGKEIKALREKGADIFEVIELNKFVFLGDTTVAVFQDHPEILEYPVIILECSFLDADHLVFAHEAYHIHWKDIESIVEKHPKVIFVLIHFSLRYKDSYIEEYFNSLPNGKPANVIPWTGSIK